MEKYRKFNFAILILTTCVAGSTYAYWKSYCSPMTCSMSLLDYTLRPLLWSALSFTVILAFLALFPGKIFRNWLLFIFTWTGPLTVFAILTTDPQSSNILSPDRGQVAWLMGGITLIATVGLVLFHYLRAKLKAEELPASLLYLLVIPPVLILFWNLRSLI